MRAAGLLVVVDEDDMALVCCVEDWLKIRIGRMAFFRSLLFVLWNAAVNIVRINR